MSPGRVRRRARRAVSEAMVVQPLSDRSARRRASAVRRSEPKHDLIVGAPGAGNIGDRAMLEALVEASPGLVVIVVRYASDLESPIEGTRVVALSDLIFGSRAARRRDLETYLALVADARSVSIIGADMLDGRYTLVGSIRRALLAELAARTGVPTSLIGFSWNASARRSAGRAVRRAVLAGATPLLRDPESATRITADGVPGVVSTADVVFTSTTLDAALADSLALSADYAVVNASGLIARSMDQTTEYVRIVRHLIDVGLDVVLLPHVLRGSSDDLVACRAIAAALDGGLVHLVEHVASPAQVRALAGEAHVVITGRMHLAVMAMSRGVPAVTLATQGKVEGLMARFDVPELCVQPRPGFGDAVIALVNEMLADDRIRGTVEHALPSVRTLAGLNVAHLGGAELEVAR